MTRPIIFSFLFIVTLMSSTFANSVQAAENTATLEVSGMTCKFCPITVRKALEQVPGVTKADVNYKTATASVKYDPTLTTIEALTTATANAGFPSTLKQ